MLDDLQRKKQREKRRLQTRRLSFEALEPRLCLTVFYDLDPVASTNQSSILDLGDRPSINDQGDIAYTALIDDEFIGAGGAGNALYISHYNGAQTHVNPEFDIWDFGPHVALNNHGQVAARDGIATPSHFFKRIRTWTAPNARSTLLRTSTPLIGSSSHTSVATRVDSNDAGDVAYVASGGTYSGREIYINSSLAANTPIGVPPPQPQLTDDPSFPTKVVYYNANKNPDDENPTPVNQRILMARRLGEAETIASPGTGGFQSVGSAPGVSDDGRIVVFSGDRGDGPGIFASYGKPGNRHIIRIAGEFDGFVDFDPEDPVRVNSTLKDQRAVTIVFQGEHQSLGTGVYSARLNFFGAAADQFDPDELVPERTFVNRIVPVVLEGESTSFGFIDELQLWDSVNDVGRGEIAFWALNRAGAEYIVRATSMEIVVLDFEPIAGEYAAPADLDQSLFRSILGESDVYEVFEDDARESLEALGVALSDTSFEQYKNSVVDAVQDIFGRRDEGSVFAPAINIRILGKTGDEIPLLSGGQWAARYSPVEPTAQNAADIELYEHRFGGGAFQLVQIGGVPGGIADTTQPPDLATGMSSPSHPVFNGSIDLFNQRADDVALVLADLGAAFAFGANVANTSTEDLANEVAGTIAHEVAHNLGLFHTFSALDGVVGPFLMNPQAPPANEAEIANTAFPLFPSERTFTTPQGQLTLSFDGLRQNSEDRLRFTTGNAGTFRTSFLEPPDDDLLEAVALRAKTVLSAKPTPQNPEAGEGEPSVGGALNEDLQVHSVVVAIFANDHQFPELIELGGGDLATLLGKAELEGGLNAQYAVLGSTDGVQVNVFTAPSSFAALAHTLTPANPLTSVLDERLRGALLGDADANTLQLFFNDGQAVREIGEVTSIPSDHAATISGVKFHDVNNDGLRNQYYDDVKQEFVDEPLLAGWTIYLDANKNDQLDAGEISTVTDQNGEYRFVGLPYGRYEINEVFQPGWVRTTPDVQTLLEPGSGLSVGRTEFEGAVFGDFDDDDDLDLFVFQGADLDTSDPAGVWLYENQGGVFQRRGDQITSQFPAGAADLNGDGAMDLLAKETVNDQFVFTAFFGDNLGGFVQGPTTNSGIEFDFAFRELQDFTGDLLPDLLLSDFNDPDPAEWTIWVNAGDGSFTPHPTTHVGSFGSTTDIDGDGDQDVLEITTTIDPDTGSEVNARRVLLNDGTGQFIELATIPSLANVIPADLDGDGDKDFAFARMSDNIHSGEDAIHLFNLGNGQFELGPTFVIQRPLGENGLPGFGGPTMVLDADNDGKEDVVFSSAPTTSSGESTGVVFQVYASRDRVSRMVHEGAAVDQDLPTLSSFGRGARDVDGDGRDDLIFTGYAQNGAKRPDRMLIHYNRSTGIQPQHEADAREGGAAYVEFGNRLAGVEIRGVKWLDRNGDTERDADEPTIANWTLFLDENDDFEYTIGEATAQTDSNGVYVFTGLAAGDYSVGEILPSNDWVQITPEDTFSFTLSEGQLGVGNFGNDYQGPLSSIEGVSWFDRDGDGQRDSGEPGLRGRTVFLDYNRNRTLDAGEPQTLTGLEGDYAFRNLAPIEYLVVEQQQAAWQRTFPATINHLVELQPGETATADFGNELEYPALAEIRGVKWEDENGNGVFDPEESPIEDWKIYLDLNGNGQHNANEPSTLTDAGGEYRFTNLLPGQYLVAEEHRAGWIQTSPGLSEELNLVRNYPLLDATDPPAVVADLDGDQKPDLAVVEDDGLVTLHFNDGEGRFADSPAMEFGQSYDNVVHGDINGDGRLDLIAGSRSSQFLKVFVQTPDGRFAAPYQILGIPQRDSYSTLAITSGDLDGDNDIDLAVAYATSNFFTSSKLEDTIAVLLNRGDGTFELPVEFTVGDGPIAIVANDFDNDGDLDLAVANSNNEMRNRRSVPDLELDPDFTHGVSLLINDGEAQFTLAPPLTVGDLPQDLVVADADGDQDDDLIVISQFDPNGNGVANVNFSVLLNNGSGAFNTKQELLIDRRLGALAAGDIDNDGNADFFVTSQEDANPLPEVILLRGIGGGFVGPPETVMVGKFAQRPLIADIDNDNDLDVVALDDGDVFVLANDGGEFNRVLGPFFTELQSFGSRFATLIDLNNDQLPELIGKRNETHQIEILSNFGGLEFSSNGFLTPIADFFSVHESRDVVAVDLDQNGAADLVVAVVEYSDENPDLPIGGRVVAALNAGDGEFGSFVELVGDRIPQQLEAGRFNGDGLPDLVILERQRVTIELGDGVGGVDSRHDVSLDSVESTIQDLFESTLTFVSTSIAIGDLNNDLNDDIVVSTTFQFPGEEEAFGGALTVLLSQGDGSFVEVPPILVEGPMFGADEPLALADFNADGLLDVAVVAELTDIFGVSQFAINVFHNQGAGQLANVGGYSVGGWIATLSSGDLNNDGLADLLTTEQFPTGYSILLNNGDDGFLPAQFFALAEQPNLAFTAKLNDDGSDDLLLVNRFDEFSVLHNSSGSLPFVHALSVEGPFNGVPHDILSGDLNGDGLPDLAATNDDHLDELVVRYNLGQRRFADPQRLRFTNFTEDDELLDLLGHDADGDGDLDLVGLVQAFDEDFNTTIFVKSLTNIGGGFRDDHSVLLDPTTGALFISDFDRDGDADFLITTAPRGGAELQLIGLGDDRLTDAWLVERLRDDAKVIADIDQDNDLDVVEFDSSSGDIIVHLHDGRGGFNATFAGAFGDVTSLTLADLNNDTVLDLAITESTGFFTAGNVHVLNGQGDGTFGSPQSKAVGFAPVDAVAAELNDDGLLDLAVVNQSSGDISVLINQGAGVLADEVFFQSELPTDAIAAGDFDGDGDQDLVVSGAVLFNDGAAGFDDVRDLETSDFDSFLRIETGYFDEDALVDFRMFSNFSGVLPFEISTSIVDIDLDGDDDILQTDAVQKRILVRRNNGQGFFDLPQIVDAGGRPHAIVGGDVTADGLADIVVAYFDSGEIGVLVNDGNGGFAPAIKTFFAIQPDDLTSVIMKLQDLDQDGDQDLVVSDSRLTRVVDSLGDGRFGESFVISGHSLDIAITEIDGDGNPEIVTIQDRALSISFNGAPPSLIHRVHVGMGQTAKDVNFGNQSLGFTWHWESYPEDVDASGSVRLNDPFLVIAEVRSRKLGALPPPTAGDAPPYIDVNNNQRLDLQDPFLAINELREVLFGNGEGESTNVEPSQHSTDSVGADWNIWPAPALDDRQLSSSRPKTRGKRQIQQPTKPRDLIQSSDVAPPTNPVFGWAVTRRSQEHWEELLDLLAADRDPVGNFESSHWDLLARIERRRR